MKKINLTFIRKAPLKGHTARITYTTKTKGTGGTTQTSITAKTILASDGSVIFPVYDLEGITSKISLKIIKSNRRLIFNKSYSVKDFLKINNTKISIGPLKKY
jgi:hypothetical protein